MAWRVRGRGHWHLTFGTHDAGYATPPGVSSCGDWCQRVFGSWGDSCVAIVDSADTASPTLTLPPVDFVSVDDRANRGIHTHARTHARTHTYTYTHTHDTHTHSHTHAHTHKHTHTHARTHIHTIQTNVQTDRQTHTHTHTQHTHTHTHTHTIPTHTTHPHPPTHPHTHTYSTDHWNSRQNTSLYSDWVRFTDWHQRVLSTYGTWRTEITRPEQQRLVLKLT